jgi:predicted phosphodiesterase
MGQGKGKGAVPAQGIRTWVVLSDLQIPFQDKPVVELVVRFIEHLRPHGVALNGDIVDAYELSTFDKNPLKKAGLDREIREAGVLMKRLAAVTSERWWLGGNHEDRLRRALWRNPEFAHLDALKFENLFHLADHGFQWKPYGGILKLGKLNLTHGNQVRKASGASARAHFEQFGGSVLHGHTHRLGAYFKTNVQGTHAAFENGCLCRLDPEYAQNPDWQQGFSVVHVDQRSRFFNAQVIPILDRRVFYFGKERFER